MKKSLLLALVVVCSSLLVAGYLIPEDYYLPTAIHIYKAGEFEKEIALNLSAGFASRKIKMISKEEAIELQSGEIKRVLLPYFENLKKTGGKLDPDEQHAYMSANQRKVCNSLSIDIEVSKEGIIGDTIYWSNRTLPFDFLNIKTDRHAMVLNSKSKTSVLLIAMAITDSIIASGALKKY